MSSRGAHDNNYSEGVGGGGSDIVLFGVRLKVQDPIRKCVSLNDLSQYAHPHAPHSSSPAGYASADDANRHRKRGIPWTEEEHKLFLLGLQNVGKGDWRGISNKFVKTRTPTQVASHAQKYFLRRSSLNMRRRRSSLFDITSESVVGISTNEEIMQGDSTKDTVIVHGSHQLVNNEFPFHQIATDLNSIISLDLSLSSGQNHFSPFLNNGESIICTSVAS